MPGRWVLAGLCAAVAGAGAGIGLAVSGPGGGAALPSAQGRVYENVDACLLTGAQGLADPVAAQAWAGMEDASRATSARVSYLAVTGPATQARAVPFANSLLVRGCRVIVASGAAERGAVLADAGQHVSVRFVVEGAAAGVPSNVTALAFAPSGLRPAVASAVEAGIRASGG